MTDDEWLQHRRAVLEWRRTRSRYTGELHPTGVREHGTVRRYKHDGCRCDDCRAAAADYQRVQRQARRQRRAA